MAKKKRNKQKTQPAAHKGATARKRERQASHSPASPHGDTRVYRLIGGLALIGLVLTAYLTYTKWFGTHPAYCSADSACDLVQSSRWSTLLGLPLSFWGLLFYATLAVSLFRIRASGRGWLMAWTIAAFGFVLSVYLTLISAIAIEATCPYCLASAIIATLIFCWLTVKRPPTGLPNWGGVAGLRLVVIAFLVTLFHFHHQGFFDPAAGPEDPQIVALIDHLNAEKVVFYGAYWCPRCQQQKKLFGSAVKRIPYVECAPNGRDGARAAVCEAKRIESYPTWMINDRPYTGLMSLRDLAVASGFSGPLP